MNRHTGRTAWTARTLAGLMLASALVLTLGQGEPKAAPAPDWNPVASVVPGDALGFISFRSAQLWDSDAGKELQKVFAVAPGGVDSLARELGLKPDEIDYAGFVMITSKTEPLLFVVAKHVVDKEKVRERLCPSGKTMRVRDREVIVEDQSRNRKARVKEKSKEPAPEDKCQEKDSPDDFASTYARSLCFLGERMYVAGRFGHMKAYINFKAGSKGKGVLSPALKEADKHQLVACLDVAGVIKQTGPNRIPPPFDALFDAEVVSVTGDVGDPWKLQVRGHFKNAASARNAKDAVNQGLQLITGQLGALPVGMDRAGRAIFGKPLEQLGVALKKAKVEQQDATLSLDLSAPIKFDIKQEDLLQLRGAADRARNSNNVKQIMLALHNFADAYGNFPADICDKDGKPLLSWRVALLPFLEDQRLYQQFKLDEPWDSDNNKKLIAKMPKLLASPGTKDKPGFTHYRVFAGPGTVYPPKGKVAKFGKGFLTHSVSFRNITDGTSNTVFVVEAKEGVEWTKPAPLTYDPKKPLPKLGQGGGKFLVGMLDGSVRYLSDNVNEKTLRALITATGGEVIQPD